MEKRIYNGKNQIVGTCIPFDEMNDITLAYNLGDMANEELKRVPDVYINKWKSWQDTQRGNPYWNNSLHC